MSKGKVFLVFLSLFFAVNNSLTAQSSSAYQRVELQIRTGIQIAADKSEASNIPALHKHSNFLANGRFFVTVQSEASGGGWDELSHDDSFLLASADIASIDNLMAGQSITEQDIIANHISNSRSIIKSRRFAKSAKTLVYTATQP